MVLCIHCFVSMGRESEDRKRGTDEQIGDFFDKGTIEKSNSN